MSKSQFGVVCALLGAVILLLAAPILAPDRTAPRFEYRIEDIPDGQLEATLDKHGDGGWELVFARRAIDEHGGDSKGIYEVIFKRPK